MAATSYQSHQITSTTDILDLIEERNATNVSTIQIKDKQNIEIHP